MKLEIKNTHPFTSALLKLKYLGISLTKYVQHLDNNKDLHNKTIMKEIKEENK